jgi:hypothetical protein
VGKDVRWLRRGKTPTNELFDAPKHVPLLGAAQRERDARFSGSSGATDAMNVILGIEGKIEIDDVGDPVDVNPTCSEIRGHQNRDLTAPEPR